MVEEKTSRFKKPLVALPLFIGGLLIFFLVLGGNPAPNTSNTESSNPSHTSAITLNQIDKNLQSGSLLIDVRTSAEYGAQHAKDAINLPLSDIQTGRMPSVAKDKIIYVYCQSGTRAAQAKELLTQEGYKNVISLGGIGNWTALGGQIITAQGKCENANGSHC